MRTLLDAAVVLGAATAATFAAFGLALASSQARGGIDGWEGVAAVVVAGLAAFLALVSSTLAALVVRRRGWLGGYLLVTVLGAAVLLAGELGEDGHPLAAAALVLAGALALWLPVGARWWLEHRHAAPPSAAPAVSRRAALTVGAGCAVAVVLAAVYVLLVAGESVPDGLAGPALVLLLVAALTSGRVPDVAALALLAGVAVLAVLFGLPERPQGGLVIAALALTVLLTFSWRSLAARLTAARTGVLEVPTVPGGAASAPDDDATALGVGQAAEPSGEVEQA